MLRMPRTVADRMRLHAEEGYPRECCGVLLGIPREDGWAVRAAVRACNAERATAHNRYRIPPEELIAIEREAQRGGLRIAGFYHSHPNGPAEWSRADLAEAHWTGCSYVIVPVAGGRAGQSRSFRLLGSGSGEKSFAEEPIELDEEPEPPQGRCSPEGFQEALRQRGEDTRGYPWLFPAKMKTDIEAKMTAFPDPQDLPELTSDDRARFLRQMVLPEVGEEGQRRLKAARVLCVGVGGLGSPLAFYLAAAGVGTLGLVDFDRVDVSNLQRQILHATPDVGRSKVDSAAEKLAALHPGVRIEKHPTRLSSANALELVKGYDVVADGTDNFAARYLVNDACVLLGKPYAYGSVYRFEGQASVFATAAGPCYRCLYPQAPPPELAPNCVEGGVLGVLPGIIGVIQAAEVLKLILGRGETLAGRLLLVDALTMRFREMKVRRNPACPACGTNPAISTLTDSDSLCEATQPALAPDGKTNGVPQISVQELKRRIDTGADVCILDVREPWEFEIANLGGLLIPQGDVLQRLGEIDRGREVVVHCKSGARSQRIAELLLGNGFPRVANLAGGIDAWASEIDHSIKKY